MSTVKVLLYPYGSDDPIITTIEMNGSNIVQIIESKFDDIPLPHNFVLLMGRNNQEDIKYQEEYGLFGNFIIAKHNYAELISLSESDINFIKENIQFLINGPYPEGVHPDVDRYIRNMSFVDID